MHAHFRTCEAVYPTASCNNIVETSEYLNNVGDSLRTKCNMYYMWRGVRSRLLPCSNISLPWLLYLPNFQYRITTFTHCTKYTNRDDKSPSFLSRTKNLGLRQVRGSLLPVKRRMLTAPKAAIQGSRRPSKPMISHLDRRNDLRRRSSALQSTAKDPAKI